MANPPTCEMQANAKVRIGKDRPAPQSSFLLLADCNVGLPHVQHAVANLEAGIDALGSAFTLPLLEHCDVNHQRRSGEILFLHEARDALQSLVVTGYAGPSGMITRLRRLGSLNF